MSWLWPIRTGQTFIDRWSLVHFAFFLVVGADWMGLGLAGKLGSYAVPAALLVALAMAFGWELAETKLEHLGVVKHPEGKLNRWVSDPIVDLIGFSAGYLLISGQ